MGIGRRYARRAKLGLAKFAMDSLFQSFKRHVQSKNGLD